MKWGTRSCLLVANSTNWAKIRSTDHRAKSAKGLVGNVKVMNKSFDGRKKKRCCHRRRKRSLRSLLSSYVHLLFKLLRRRRNIPRFNTTTTKLRWSYLGCTRRRSGSVQCLKHATNIPIFIMLLSLLAHSAMQWELPRLLRDSLEY